MPFDDDCRGEPVDADPSPAPISFRSGNNSQPARDPLDGFAAFAAEVRARLDAGRLAYGDASFSKAPAELVAELQQEALDLAGWGFVLWCRLERMRAALSPMPAGDVGDAV